jgi:phage baseplate assembly protein W
MTLRAITYPFTLGFFGVVDTTTDIGKIYTDRVLTLLSTNVNQFPMRPDYGTDMGTALFENENLFPPAAQQAVRDAISKWIPEVAIDKMTVSPPDREGNAAISITLLLPDNTLTTINTTSAILASDGTLTVQ